MRRGSVSKTVENRIKKIRAALFAAWQGRNPCEDWSLPISEIRERFNLTHSQVQVALSRLEREEGMQRVQGPGPSGFGRIVFFPEAARVDGMTSRDVSDVNRMMSQVNAGPAGFTTAPNSFGRLRELMAALWCVKMGLIREFDVWDGAQGDSVVFKATPRGRRFKLIAGVEK